MAVLGGPDYSSCFIRASAAEDAAPPSVARWRCVNALNLQLNKLSTVKQLQIAL
jgi:hypothetical protein